MSAEKQQSLVPVKHTTPAIQVVAYVRMSTEHQRYSILNQLTMIKQYAAEHHLSLIRAYSDEGISGLKIDNRLGLQSLIKAIAGGKRDFSKVLVYDISRWGRFQDPDEGAYYEYFCRRNGVDVIYCAEPFQDDLSPLSAVIKSVKRAMAAEYSRELGARVFRGSCNLANRGYNTGGGAPYGLKNLVVDPNGKVLKRMPLAYRKTLRGHHVVLAPGPAREVKVVREIFRRYVELDETVGQIAAHLNARGCRTRRDGPWVDVTITYMLTNEKYIGTQVYNRSTSRLQARRRNNAPAEWIRKLGAFTGIVDPVVFERAQVKRAKELHGPPLCDEQLLSALRDFIQKHGVVTSKMLGGKNGMPGPLAYKRHFGSIKAAYDLVGYNHWSKSYNWNERERLRGLRRSILAKIERTVRCAGGDMAVTSSGRFFIGRRLPCSFRLAKFYSAKEVGPRWYVRIRRIRGVDIHLVGRLCADGITVRDYYLIPNDVASAVPQRLGLQNSPDVDQYRCSNLTAVTKRLASVARSSSTRNQRAPGFSRALARA